MIDTLPSTRIVLIGTGRFARSIACTMPDRIAAVVARGEARAIASIVPDVPIVERLADVDPGTYDVVWIAASDTALAELAERIGAERESWEGIVVLHSSGATSPEVLEPLERRGATVMALHPNGSFAGDAPISSGLVWSISSRAPSIEAIAKNLLHGLDPKLVPIDDNLRALYHAAASVAANYSVALFAVAVDLYRGAGLSEEDARQVVARFMIASAERSAAIGPRDALTGPIARGDHAVVERQIEALRQHAPEYIEVFEALAAEAKMLAEGRNDEC